MLYGPNSRVPLPRQLLVALLFPLHGYSPSGCGRRWAVLIMSLLVCHYRISSKNWASLIIRHPFTQMGKIVSNFGKGIPKYLGI